MKTKCIRELLALGAIVAATGAGCMSGGTGDVEETGSALTGFGGIGSTGAGGTKANDKPAVRGFTLADGTHEAVFRVRGSSTLSKATGTPFGTPVSVSGSAQIGSNPWGYKRHDGPDTIVYLDQNSHVHEVGTADIDFAMSFGINAPLAATAPWDGSGPVPDLIGYLRGDNQSSALVYRSRENHVIEIRSNFSAQPPWLVTDLTNVSGANVTAPIGSAFPFVQSDGWNTILYFASDSHIHQLANNGSSQWYDNDVYVMSGETVAPSSDPWGYKRSDGWNAVVFVGADSKIHELANDTLRWYRGILPSIQAVGGLYARPSGYIRADNVNAVVYTGGDNAIHELSLSSGWIDSVLPTPNARSSGQLFGHLAPGNRSSVLFQGGDQFGANHRYELSLQVGGQWVLQAF